MIEEDLKRLEETLNGPDLYITEETLQKAFQQGKGTLVQFIKQILGMYEFPEPAMKITEAFRAFIVEKNYLNSDQVNFLRTIQTVFLEKHHIEYRDFYGPPFTNYWATLPVNEEDLKQVIVMCNNLEKEVFNANA